MPSINVFEPPLCCNTGVCGPELDQKLVNFTADLNHVSRLGADITRFNLASDPAAFAAKPQVVAFLKTVGSEGLPLVLVDDVTVAAGRYPTRAELARYAGVTLAAAEPAAVADGCCGGPTPAVEVVSDGCCGGPADVAEAEATGCCGSPEPVEILEAEGCCGGPVPAAEVVPDSCCGGPEPVELVAEQGCCGGSSVEIGENSR